MFRVIERSLNRTDQRIIYSFYIQLLNRYFWSFQAVRGDRNYAIPPACVNVNAPRLHAYPA